MASTPTAASSPCPGFSPALAPTLARVAATDDFSAGRFRNRLSALPAAALLDIAALACEGSAAARKRAEELIALHNPTPVWAVSNILLSPDLLGKMMATLNLSDYAAAAVCKTWACTWREMVRARACFVLRMRPPEYWEMRTLSTCKRVSKVSQHCLMVSASALSLLVARVRCASSARRSRRSSSCQAKAWACPPT